MSARAGDVVRRDADHLDGVCDDLFLDLRALSTACMQNACKMRASRSSGLSHVKLGEWFTSSSQGRSRWSRMMS